MGRVTTIIVAVLGLFSAAIFAFYAVTPWIDHAAPVTHSHSGDCILYVALTAAALGVSAGVITRKVWAWWTAVVGSVFLLGVAGWLLWSDGKDAILSFVLLTMPALTSLVLLLLRSTRAWYFKPAE